MSGGGRPGERYGFAAVLAACADQQKTLTESAETETETDIFGQAVVKPGRGRRPGQQNLATRQQVAHVLATGQSPLAYLASVWRDPAQKTERRIAAATAALPYVHKRLPQAVDLTASSAVALRITLGDDDGDFGPVIDAVATETKIEQIQEVRNENLPAV